ncbi:MAG: hypothetical protein ABRQ25_07225 [Clostridiaceae bacterium]
MVKSLKTENVKKGESISFSFDTSLKHPGNLIVRNENNKQNFGLVEQKLNGNSFVVPEESGEQIFMISGFWDETHSVDYAFKINIQ